MRMHEAADFVGVAEVGAVAAAVEILVVDICRVIAGAENTTAEAKGITEMTTEGTITTIITTIPRIITMAMSADGTVVGGQAGGMGLPIVGKMLGHARSETTQRYAHLSADPVKAAAAAVATRIAAGLDGAVSADIVAMRQKALG